MRLKSIGVLRGYAMGKTQLSRIADNIEHEVEEALESEHSENAKLRELVRDALRPKYDDTLRMPPAKWREYDADVLRRARELGIEVDG